MREKAYLYFIHVLFSLSLVLLSIKTTTATSLGHQLVAAAEGNANYKCIDKERQALLDFKTHVQDPDNMLYNWGPEEDDCCQWDGVACDDVTGHVTGLQLNNLGGEITPSLLNLTYLTHLSLDDSFFQGTIPMFICSMTHLTSLSLSWSEFTGTIPESIGNITQLTYLNLSNNNFSGTIPRSIGSLPQLKSLYLSSNSFHGTIPTEFGNVTNLVSLYLDSLGSCSVENLDWLSSLYSLEVLLMDEIFLGKANNWVNVVIGLQNLSFLSLVGCDLSQVMHPYSPSVKSSSSIDSLNLDNNNLNSSMYRWLCPLTGSRLKYLFLYGNKFDGKLSDFLKNLSGCASATLQRLDASSNQFKGSLSDEIQNFSSLERLNLSSNQLDGAISDKLWQLPNLQRLHLSSNSLRGSISENIAKSNLWYIDLSYNSIEGVLFNDDLSNFSQSIEYIDISSNNLGPRFPMWIQKLKNLTHFDLSNNSISDTVSTEHWNRWKSLKLSYLDLSFNNISGKLPKSLSNHDLEFIDLSFNNFYGPIPAFPVLISFLDLSRNKFHGGISFLCQIYGKIEFLDISHNSLTGKIPDCFCNVKFLEVLNLGHNTLSGSIPPSVGCLGQLETLSLNNNSFSGELPLSLKNCTKLGLLDLGANKLYGIIPVWIGECLSRLYTLSLHSNNFFGAIPSQICQLVSLQILDLSYNNLNEKIPSCVNNLTSMVEKGISVEQNVHNYHSSVYLKHLGFLIEEGVDDSYIDHLLIKWQGKVNDFSRTMGLVKTIDLSSNNLTGQIPFEITNLHGLLVVDLSNNALVGEIPQDICQMKELLTLNLSRNMFSGEIPSTISKIDRLNNLDVSYNNLSGRVPSSTQLQSFPPEWFAGNTGLCGLPTRKKCLEDEDQGVPPVDDSEGDGKSTNELWRWFYIGGATGFASAFWIACSTLLLNRRLRHAFFYFHTCLQDWLYVKVAVFITKLQRVACG